VLDLDADVYLLVVQKRPRAVGCVAASRHEVLQLEIAVIAMRLAVHRVLLTMVVEIMC
jgi:hypothetical protein